MAANEPNKPDNVISIDKGNKTQAEKKPLPISPCRLAARPQSRKKPPNRIKRPRPRLWRKRPRSLQP